MVKRGGTKRKAEIKKITDKNSKAVTFTKRRDGLFSKAAQLCLLGDAQIAILATPSSSNSNVSFFSFGHSSVDSVVSAYLSGQRPAPVCEESKEMREDIGICMARKELGLGYWWEDETIASKSPTEIMQAMESMKILLRDAERLLGDEAVDFDQRKGSLVVHVKNDVAEQTLIVDDQPASFNNIAEQTLITTEDDQIMPVCDSFCNYNKNAALSTTHAEENLEEWSDMDFEQLLNGFDFVNKTVEEDDDDDHQVVAVSENSCSNNNNALLLPAAAGELNDEQEVFGFDITDLNLDSIFEGLCGDEFADSFLMY